MKKRWLLWEYQPSMNFNIFVSQSWVQIPWYKTFMPLWYLQNYFEFRHLCHTRKLEKIWKRAGKENESNSRKFDGPLPTGPAFWMSELRSNRWTTETQVCLCSRADPGCLKSLCHFFSLALMNLSISFFCFFLYSSVYLMFFSGMT